MFGACEIRGTEEKCIQFWQEKLQECDHLVGLDVNGRMSLKQILENMRGAD
jgi:hypothetical protein